MPWHLTPADGRQEGVWNIPGLLWSFCVKFYSESFHRLPLMLCFMAKPAQSGSPSSGSLLFPQAQPVSGSSPHLCTCAHFCCASRSCLEGMWTLAWRAEQLSYEAGKCARDAWLCEQTGVRKRLEGGWRNFKGIPKKHCLQIQRLTGRLRCWGLQRLYLPGGQIWQLSRSIGGQALWLCSGKPEVWFLCRRDH